MKVSIVIPALNEAVGIAQSIERALATQPHEVIVVDGGSTDGTSDIARTSDCQVVQSQRGRAWQQNAGAKVATGDTLLFLHADSWLDPDGLAQIQLAMSRRRALCGAFQNVIESGGLIYRLIERGNTLRARVLQMAYGDQGLFVDRSLFEKVGGFPRVHLMEDVLLVRKLRRYSPLTLLPGPLYTSARRWAQAGPIRQTARNWLILLAESLGVSPDTLSRFYTVAGLKRPHDESAAER